MGDKHEPPTDEELDRWERMVANGETIIGPNAKGFTLLLIREVKRLRKENEELRRPRTTTAGDGEPGEYS